MTGPRAPNNPVINGMKVCARCRVNKPATEFYPKKSGGVESYCPPCKNARRVEDRAKAAGGPDLTIRERFEAKVDRSGGPDACHNWTGALSNRGYGAIMYRGLMHPAHRVAMELDGHTIDYKAQVVDHACKNIRCVNTRHLRICTQAENCREYAENGVSYKNWIKTHCHRGHEFTPENTFHYLGTAGLQRHCIICHRIKSPGSKRQPTTREEAIAKGRPRSRKAVHERSFLK